MITINLEKLYDIFGSPKDSIACDILYDILKHYKAQPIFMMYVPTDAVDMYEYEYNSKNYIKIKNNAVSKALEELDKLAEQKQVTNEEVAEAVANALKANVVVELNDGYDVCIAFLKT